MNGIVTCRWGFRWTVHLNLQPWTSVFTLQLLWVSSESKMVLAKSEGLNFERVCAAIMWLVNIWSLYLWLDWTLVFSVLLYASEMWTLPANDVKAVESFHMKCQWKILGMRWHGFIWNTKVTSHTGLLFVSSAVCVWPDCEGQAATFGHALTLPDTHQALLHQVGLSVGQVPDPTWKHQPGCPHAKWPVSSAVTRITLPSGNFDDKLSAEVTVERYFTASWLRVDDNDDLQLPYYATSVRHNENY